MKANQSAHGGAQFWKKKTAQQGDFFDRREIRSFERIPLHQKFQTVEGTSENEKDFAIKMATSPASSFAFL